MLRRVKVKFLEQAKGCLIGLAIGDALGATNEFKTREAITSAGLVSEMVGGGWLNLTAGDGTDDTEMMMCILEAYAQGFSLERVSQNFLTWFAQEPKDIGNVTTVALTELKRGVSPRESGKLAAAITRHSSASNAAIMRSAPTAIFRASDREVRVMEGTAIARMTHWDQRSVEAALWLNATIAALLSNATDAEALQAAQNELEFARVSQAWDIPDADVLTWVNAATTLEIDHWNTSGYALATAQCAAWVFTRAESFEDGMLLAINQGGDADTIGAVVGALLGAKFGFQNIPERWIKPLLVGAKLEKALNQALALHRE